VSLQNALVPQEFLGADLADVEDGDRHCFRPELLEVSAGSLRSVIVNLKRIASHVMGIDLEVCVCLCVCT
jgi:hypothetical protein